MSSKKFNNNNLYLKRVTPITIKVFSVVALLTSAKGHLDIRLSTSHHKYAICQLGGLHSEKLRLRSQFFATPTDPGKYLFFPSFSPFLSEITFLIVDSHHA